MKSKAEDGAHVFRLFNEIGILAQLSGAAFERVMPSGMTMPQFVVLNHMVRLGDAKTPLELARAMQVAKGAMTNTLQHLERKGFITMRPDDRDGRSKRVMLTDGGRATRERCVSALAPDLQFVAAALVPEQLSATLRVLEFVRRLLDERRR